MVYQLGHNVNKPVYPRAPPPVPPLHLSRHNTCMPHHPPVELDAAQRNVARLMHARGATAGDLARACNCSRELVYRWLNGKRRITDARLRQLADFFGVSESYLKFGSPNIDTDKLGDVAAGAVEALIEAGVIRTDVTAEQIGNFVAQIFQDYELGGDIDHEQLRRYVRILAPARAGDQPKQ